MKRAFLILFTIAAMAYDPRTGITTYDDPTKLDTLASDPVPSTATSFAPPAAPASAPWALGYLDYNALPEYLRFRGANPDETPEGIDRNSPNPFATVWGQQLGLDNNYNYAIMPDGSVQQLFVGSDPNASQYDPFSGGGEPRSATLTAQQLAEQFGWDYTNAPRDAHGYAMPGRLDGLDFAASTNPGMHGDGIWGMLPQIIFNVLANMIPGGQIAAAGTTGGMAAEDAGDNPLKGAAIGMLTAGLSQFADLGSLGIPSYVTPAITQAATGMLSGQSTKDALTNAALTAGIGAGANAAAPYVNSALDSLTPPPVTGALDSFNPDAQYAGANAAGDATKRTNYLTGEGVQTDFGPSTGYSTVENSLSDFKPKVNYLTGEGVQTGFGRSTGYSTAPELDPFSTNTIGEIGARKALEAQSTGMLPASGMLAPSVAGEPQPTATPEAPRDSTTKALESIGKFGAALAKMHDGRGEPEDAPQRQEGQTDAQYGQTLAEYAHVDPQVLADSGFTPGTPEYYQFVMDQLDSVIAQVTNGLDPDDASLSDKLHTKSREELDALERALYVRGQLGTLMGSGKYTDPFTGLGEDVNTNGAQVNPSVAAYHRGLYRSAGDLARMSPTEARKHVGGMLDRSPDLFGMQGAHNARTLDEILSQQNMDPEDIKRRRGMFAQDPFANLGSMSERDLEATLASLLH